MFSRVSIYIYIPLEERVAADEVEEFEEEGDDGVEKEEEEKEGS